MTSSTAVKVFDLDGRTLEAYTDEEGEPWFSAPALAKVLDYRDAQNMTRNLDEDEVVTKVVPVVSANGVSQNREVTLVSESGLYHAIFLSKRQDAKAIRRWVTGVVMPSIRKTNKYDHAEHLAQVKAKLEDVAKELTMSKSFMVEVARAHSDADLAQSRQRTAQSILDNAEKALATARKASAKLPKREKALVLQAIEHFEQHRAHIVEAKSEELPWFPWEVYDYLAEDEEE